MSDAKPYTDAEWDDPTNEIGNWERTHAYVDALRKRLEEADALTERLRMEAQIQAQEMRSHRATVREAYQVCTGATGEPGSWNGAEPIRALKARADKAESETRELKALLGECLAYVEWHWTHGSAEGPDEADPAGDTLVRYSFDEMTYSDDETERLRDRLIAATKETT